MIMPPCLLSEAILWHNSFLFWEFWVLGVGLALAEEFLRNGDNVVVCSRSGAFLTKIRHPM